VEAFRFQHSEIMKMPFRTFLAYSRVATARAANTRIRQEFEG
jgi:hypothetical protein